MTTYLLTAQSGYKLGVTKRDHTNDIHNDRFVKARSLFSRGYLRPWDKSVANDVVSAIRRVFTHVFYIMGSLNSILRKFGFFTSRKSEKWVPFFPRKDRLWQEAFLKVTNESLQFY